ncbi:MAG: hypothetical protein C0460_07975 [Methylibium sp.]|nr:hypothetical protein [Methylibium sp.]
MTAMYFAPRGLGLIELMVGITVGLIVAAGASLVAVNQINEHRRLMLEIQVQQDLRTAADLVQQELRRAGFRGRADLGVWSPPQGVGTLKQLEARPASVNEFMPVDTSDTRNLIRRPLLVSKSDTTGTVMTFVYAQGTPYSPTGVPDSGEYRGFKWDKSTGVLSLALGLGATLQPNWQPITDPDSVTITNFDVSVVTQSVSLGQFCENACNAGTPNCPVQEVYRVNFTLTGKAKHDANVVRTLTGTERVRAAAINGACP